MRSKSLVSLFYLTLLAACGTTSVNQKAERSSGSEISTEEIREASQLNAYDLVRALRPYWLQKRGQNSLLLQGDIVVYLNDVRLGGPAELRQISTDEIGAIRRLSASEATRRWGMDHTYGAIVVSYGAPN